MKIPELVSPRSFLIAAAVLLAAYGVAHLAGWREETRFLSGTRARVEIGAIYLFLHFGAFILAPAFVVGAGVFALLRRRRAP